MPRLIYCPFTGCCPLRVAAYTDNIASRLINTDIIPFMRDVFSININYDELMKELFRSIEEYCERELESIERALSGVNIVVVKACKVLPRISDIIKIDRYSSSIAITLKKIPAICLDEPPGGSIKYRVNYRLSEAAARTIIIYTAIYAIYRIKGVKPLINGEQIVDIFSKQLSNTWRSKIRLIPIVIDGIELYLNWNKKDFITQLKKLLVSIARQNAIKAF